MQLRVRDEVARLLGQPTVESLHARSWALPTEPVAMPRRLRRIARWFGGFPRIPILLVFPELGQVWVELVGPGEAINRDLEFYRERLGLGTEDGDSTAPTLDAGDARAWINDDGNLVATVKGYTFATYVPLTDRFARLVRQVGFIRLTTIVSGISIDSKRSVRLADLHDAALDGRMVSAAVKLVAAPASPDTAGEDEG